jgi:hypothetical protein
MSMVTEGQMFENELMNKLFLIFIGGFQKAV